MKIFEGRIPTSTTIYFPLTVVNGTVGCSIGWKDATSAATITVELTSNPGTSYTAAGAAWEWTGSGATITGPTAAAASSSTVNIENVRQTRARLKIVTTAVCQFAIYDGTPG
jgi:hypothetical protein